MMTWKYARIGWYWLHNRVSVDCTDALVIQTLRQAIMTMDPGIKDETPKTKGKTLADRYRDSHSVQFGHCDIGWAVTWVIEQLGEQGWEPFAETVDREGARTVSLRCRME